MPILQANNSGINYEVRQNAAPQDMLFLHGNIASNRWWYPALTEFEKLQKNSFPSSTGKIVLSELRGCGQSLPLAAEYKMTYDDMVQDAISLTETLDLKNTILVGHSTGGLIACLLMSRRPDLFKGAILIDPVGPKGIVFPDDLFEKYDVMAKDQALTSQIIGATIYQNDFNSEFFKTAIVEDTFQSLQKAGTQIIRALRGIDVTAEVAKVLQPSVIFHGQHDWVLEEAHATDLNKLMKNSRFVNLPENGHCLNMENPVRLAEELKQFFLTVGPQAAPHNHSITETLV